MTLQRCTCAAMVVAACGLGTAAHAGKVKKTDLPVGTSLVDLLSDGVSISVSASGGTFAKKSTGGLTSVGVLGGDGEPEIGGSESILFSFSEPVTITKLNVAHLYVEGEYNDHSDEIAQFLTTQGTFELIADQDVIADWNGFGTVSNLSPAVHGKGGGWKIKGADIFGGPITSLTLISGDPGLTMDFSDFGFRVLKFKTVPVPAPGALALLGAAGLVTRRSRRRD